jgi:endoglucanase
MPMPRDGGLPGVGSYTTTAGQVLNPATTDPGFGGLAFWPSPASLHTQSAAAPFRGTNLVGMEMFYGGYNQATGPEVDQNYVAHDERVVDYFAGKGITTLRFLFSWEGMQSQLFGPIPAANDGNYKAYFDNYLRIVDYATNTKGMKVIAEPWQATAQSGAGGPRWRGDLVGSPQVSIAAWSDFWTKMATILKDNPRVSFGLVNEPNNMSTMGWWTIAQAGVTAIRNSGATNRIYVPGNGYTAASSWTQNFYDTAAPQRSNAYGWLNANAPGQPIFDPLGNIAAEVHTYLDANEGGLGDDITSITAAREHLTPVIEEGRARGYKVYLGEIGMYANTAGAPDAWADFIAYFEANPDEFAGFTWWAGGDPAFWALTIHPYFSISPINPDYTGDSVNMDMIEDFF